MSTPRLSQLFCLPMALVGGLGCGPGVDPIGTSEPMMPAGPASVQSGNPGASPPSPPAAGASATTQPASTAPQGNSTPTGTGPGTATPEAGTACIHLDKITLAYYKDRLYELTGAKSFQLDGRDTTIPERSKDTNRANARALLRKEFESMGYSVTEHKYGGTNLIAERKGVDDKIVVIGAHYDGVPNIAAADDDGAGTIGILTAARALSTCSFTHTLRFLAFDQEEIGLVGSRAYVDKLVKDGESQKLLGMLEVEGISWDANGDGNFHANDCGGGGPEANKTVLAAIQSAITKGSLPLKPVIERDPCRTASDMGSFWGKKLPAMVICNASGDDNGCYHQACDTVEKVHFEFSVKMTKLVTLTAVELAGVR